MSSQERMDLPHEFWDLVATGRAAFGQLEQALSPTQVDSERRAELQRLQTIAVIQRLDTMRDSLQASLASTVSVLPKSPPKAKVRVLASSLDAVGFKEEV